MLNVVGDHIALYQLTLERGTKLFEQVMSRKVVRPSLLQPYRCYNSSSRECVSCN